MAIKASPATGNINASGRVTAAEFAAQSVSAFRVGSGALVEQAMPTTESSSKPISITGIVQWVRGLIGKFYEKPEGGIPKSDLVSSVQTSLNKADAAQPKIDDLNTIRERARTGNEHAGIKDGNPHNTKFADLVAKPTTLTGYGVTAADPATVSAEGGADDNKAADAVKTKQYVEYMVGSNTARFQGEFATADDIPTEVTQYATKTAPTNNDYIVIRDMSEYGKTGNLFSSIDADVGSINAKGEIDATMTNFRHTTLLPLSGKDEWHIHLVATNAGVSAMFRLHAYDANGAWIGQVAVAQSVDGKVEMRGIVPKGTSSFRVSYLVNATVTVFAHEHEGTWRWIYSGVWADDGRDGWSPAFQMSSEPFTPAQMAALNSGATEEKIIAIESKLDKTDVTAPASDVALGKAADAKSIWDKLGAFFKNNAEVVADIVRGSLRAKEIDVYDAEKGIFTFCIINDELIITNDYGAILKFPLLKNGNGTLALTSDIADATKLTPVYGEWKFETDDPDGGWSATPVLDHEHKTIGWTFSNAKGVFEIANDTDLTVSHTYTDYIEGSEVEYHVAASRSIVGYKLGKATAGTDPTLNGMSADDITEVAEAACADNPSASVASLEGRVVPCVSGASGTVDVSFAARKDGDTTLRFFDVLIKDVPSGGCQINLPPTESFIYGNALKAEEGWNHYSFAEFKDGDSYKWAVNRVKMSTSQS